MVISSYKFNIVFIWFFWASVVEGMSHKIDQSFKLIFWGAELGEFQVKVKADAKKYSVSTNASGKSLIRLLSSFEVSSGAVGNFKDNGDLMPRQSISRWNIRGKFRQTQLNYQDGTLTAFEASPELTKKYHINNPIGLKNTIDPVSLVLWLLINRGENQICKGKVKILDGFRMSELSFEKIDTSQDLIVCSGKIERIQGFKNLDLKRKPVEFKITYSVKNTNFLDVPKFEIQTIFGKMILEKF